MIAILKYSAGNILSVKNALDRLSCESIITNDPAELDNCDKLIIPGVGEAGSAMRSIAQSGMDDYIRAYKKPLLGICLGMQILCEHSEESNTRCLGIFDCKVKKFDESLKVPHMGWNAVTELTGEMMPVIDTTTDLYFVHSFYAELCSDTSSVCHYSLPFSASLERQNFFGTQFHPEKSAAEGEKILKRFIEL